MIIFKKVSVIFNNFNIKLHFRHSRPIQLYKKIKNDSYRTLDFCLLVTVIQTVIFTIFYLISCRGSLLSLYGRSHLFPIVIIRYLIKSFSFYRMFNFKFDLIGNDIIKNYNTARMRL